MTLILRIFSEFNAHTNRLGRALRKGDRVATVCANSARPTTRCKIHGDMKEYIVERYRCDTGLYRIGGGAGQFVREIFAKDMGFYE